MLSPTHITGDRITEVGLTEDNELAIKDDTGQWYVIPAWYLQLTDTPPDEQIECDIVDPAESWEKHSKTLTNQNTEVETE